MHVEPITSESQLDRLAGPWNCLTRGVPFRTHAWNRCWWQHYGRPAGGRGRCMNLMTLAVYDDAEQLVGVAPWVVRRQHATGRVIRWLGGGEICSDYLSVLCTAPHEAAVVEALASALAGPMAGAWDLLELTAVDAEDSATLRLADALARRGHLVHRRNGPNCWRLALPDSWDALLQSLSKSHRGQLRRLDRRVLQSGRAQFHTVKTPEELARAWDILADLHQRRRTSLGEPGCFASEQFTQFHRQATADLLEAESLGLHWIALDGSPVAIDYVIYGGNIAYVYQGGIDPDRLDEQPGRLMQVALLQKLIGEKFSAVDFLRGDEPYKAHLRASPRPSVELRIVPPRVTARLRHRTWLAGSKTWRLAKRAFFRTSPEAARRGKREELRSES